MSVIETQGFKLDNSGKRVVVDPVTRIEGHLRVEVNLDDKNVIRNAVSTGTMWRGLEVILKAWRSSSRAATRVMRGRSSNASAACAPARMRWSRCAQWKTR